ncbi:MAG: transcription termination factor NusA [Campylobacter sp.]|nr:transcription termination factor NusA [Campylobacter sp.]
MERIGDIIESIANEKNLNLEDVKTKVETAFINTARRLFGNDYAYEAHFSPNSKDIKLFRKISVVSDDDERAGDELGHIAIGKVKANGIEANVGDEISYDINLEELGRTAAGALSKELNYHIQKLVDETMFNKYQNKVGEIIFGNVVSVDKDETTYLEFEDIKVYMPRKNRIKGEVFKVGQIVRAVIRKIYAEKNQGIKIEISRTSPKFLEAMLKTEVPEIKDGSVVVQKCARIPGERAKISLVASRPNVDAVGATVGIKGVRINAVSAELNGENIDVVEYSPKPEIFISRAMAPAIVNSVQVENKKAKVFIGSDQKSKAIGKKGINIRLASMLTGYDIELVESEAVNKEELTNEGLKNLQDLFGGL